MNEKDSCWETDVIVKGTNARIPVQYTGNTSTLFKTKISASTDDTLQNSWKQHKEEEK